MATHRAEQDAASRAGLGAALLYQISTTVALAGGAPQRLAAKALVLGAARLLWEARGAYLGVRQLEAQRARFANEGAERYDGDDFMGSEMGTPTEGSVLGLADAEEAGGGEGQRTG